MLAGLVLISVVVGALATGGVFALAAPTWMALAAYPAVCSVTLLLTAAVWSSRTQNADAVRPVLRVQG